MADINTDDTYYKKVTFQMTVDMNISAESIISALRKDFIVIDPHTVKGLSENLYFMEINKRQEEPFEQSDKINL